MKCYFIDKEIYFQNKKMPDRKVELFNVKINGCYVTGYDKDGNLYHINKSELIIEDKTKNF